MSSLGSVQNLIHKYDANEVSAATAAVENGNSGHTTTSSAVVDVGLIQRKTVGGIISYPGDEIPKLFTPFKIRGQTFQNKIQIHGAHGYLIHEFLSGNTNKRTDQYGGTFENRIRFVIEIISAIRGVIPKGMPLFLRVSGTDYSENRDILAKDPNGWDIYQVIELCRKAVPKGLDVIDISSGGNLSSVIKGITPSDFGSLVPLAEVVKKTRIEGLLVATVGCMHDGKQAEKVLQDGRADIVMVGRQFLKDPSLVNTLAQELGVKVRWASQYSWMWALASST